MNTKNCFIGQSGGPTVAINASLAGVITQCQEKDLLIFMVWLMVSRDY